MRQPDNAVPGDFVARVRQLPLVPALAIELARSVQDDRLGAVELGRRIGADAALAAQLLRLVNSPFYGLSRRVGTIGDAIALLGFNLVRRIVSATLLQNGGGAALADEAATRAFWRHQLLVASVARAVHDARGDEGCETAYMAGLLHDLGRLALRAWQPYAAGALAPSHAVGDGALVADERARHGIDHAQAGAALLAAWQLPPPIVDAVRAHADETAPADALAASVWQANRLVHRIEDGVLDDDAWRQDSGLSPAHRDQLVSEVDAIAGMRS